jgi:hypothetical protein
MTVVLSDLAVPQCRHCGELVFDYLAEDQINQAYQAQVRLISGGNGQAGAAPVGERGQS